MQQAKATQPSDMHGSYRLAEERVVLCVVPLYLQCFTLYGVPLLHPFQGCPSVQAPRAERACLNVKLQREYSEQRETNQGTSHPTARVDNLICIAERGAQWRIALPSGWPARKSWIFVELDY